MPNYRLRKTKHVECRIISLLLGTLAKHNYLDYPITISKQESPDYLVQFNNIDIGIEITEAINEDYAKARKLPEANSGHTLIDMSLLKYGSPSKSTAELRNIVMQKN